MKKRNNFESNSVTENKKRKKAIKEEHQIVLYALEKANQKNARMCLLREVIIELSESDKNLLNQAYAKSVSFAVSSILILLTARRLVVTIRTETKQCFFGAKNILESFNVPEIKSRRRKVLALVEKAVEHHKTAVRIEEVLIFAQETNQKFEVSARKITQDIIGLTQTGELKRIETESFGFRGNTFYLPSYLSEVEYIPTDTSNWLEKVYKCFQIVWKAKVEEAEIINQKISPLTTSEVRKEFYEQHPNAVSEVSAKRFINMLLYLSTSNFPKLRKINNPNYNSSGWLPMNISDKEVLPANQFYASDAERVEEAIRRFERNYQLPANIQNVENEINKDVRLKLKSNFSIARMLNNAAKPMTVNKFSNKVQRKVRYVGSVDGRMYYTAGEIEFELAETMVSIWKLKSQFEKLNYVEEIKSINSASLPLLQYGRLHLLGLEIEKIKSCLGNLGWKSKLNSEFTEIEELKFRVSFAFDEIEIYKGKYRKLINEEYNLPQLLKEVSTCENVGLIPSEVMEIVYPFYPTARKLKRDNQLVTFFHEAVKRFQNPNFKNRFSKIPKEAVEYLFDRTELLIHTASKWGNRFAHLQALIAKQELGALRNPKYILPLLNDKDFTVRLKAVSCLAFMYGGEIEVMLNEAIKTDVEPNVRQIAKWALALSKSNFENLKQVFSSYNERIAIAENIPWS